MENMPLVSVVIPVYNGSNYLAKAIDSVLAQTYKFVEIIVVNDGSQDNGKTEAIALSYGNKVRYFHKENGGVSTALNFAIERMKGEYFAWLSHDDMFLPYKIELQMNAILESGDSMAISCGNFIAEEIKTGKFFHVRENEYFDETKLVKGVYSVFRGAVNGCTVLFHKNHFERVGMFDETLRTTQDYDMWFRIFRRQNILFSEIPLSLIRVHQEQGSVTISSYQDERDELFLNCMNKMTKEEILYIWESEYRYYHDLLESFTSWKLDKSIQESKNKIEELEKENVDLDDINVIKEKIINEPNGVYIFGAGQIGRKLGLKLRLIGIKINGMIDNDPGKQGESIEGILCYNLGEIKKEALIIVAVKQKEAILKQLLQAGYRNVYSDYNKLFTLA